MRKLLIALVVLTTGAVLATGTVLATGAPSTVPDPAAPAPALTTPAPSPEEEPLEITFADPVNMAGCTAEQTCSNGSTVSCTGWDVCKVFSASVECDGNVVSCPQPCAVSTRCCTGNTISCSGQETCEVQEAQWVRCDGGYPDGTMGFCALCPDYPY